MNYQDIIAKIDAYIKGLLEGANACYCFHNDSHTSSVVDASREIAAYYKLSERDSFVVVAAAYFHDLGYLDGGVEGHEIRGAAAAVRFLSQHGVEAADMEQVQACILSTKMPQNPTNLLEQILCDADLFHIGSAEFVQRDKLLKKEIESVGGKTFSAHGWREGTLTFLKNHRFHTSYAQEKLNPGKEKNIIAIQELKETVENRAMEEVSSQEDKKEKKKKKDKGAKDSKPDRGIETMFRITSTNNQRLSDMADNKSNILITVNSIILSVVIALLLRKLDNNAYLIIPTLLLLLVSLVTVVVAILATRPKVSAGYFSQDDVDRKEANLLFFGNFYKMDLQDYKSGMLKAMGDREYLYGMLIKDVYSQGVVLGRKYRLLRYAYSIFMYGIIVAVLAFIIAVYSVK